MVCRAQHRGLIEKQYEIVMKKYVKKLICLTVLCPILTCAQCVEWSLKTGRYQLPVLTTTVEGVKAEFIWDLGMARALSLEPSLFKKLAADKPIKKSRSFDLSGKDNTVQKVHFENIVVENYSFKDVDVEEHHAWGLWLNSDNDQNHNLNVIGRGLFKEPGMLFYSRKDQILRWCDRFDQELVNKETIQWVPWIVDDEGVHLHLIDEGRLHLDLVLDSAATVSILKSKAYYPVKTCEKIPNNQCSDFKKPLSLMDLTVDETFYLSADLSEDFKADGLLGNTFFEKHDLLLDSRNKKVGIFSRQI